MHLVRYLARLAQGVFTNYVENILPVIDHVDICDLIPFLTFPACF